MKEQRIARAKLCHKMPSTRRYEANKRMEISSKMTSRERLEKLNSLFGNNIGATKERIRLSKEEK